MTDALRVLLVEDDPDVAAGLGDWLARRGLVVDFAARAGEARALLQADTYDVAVFDVNLPGEDGLSLCRAVKHDWKLSMPVIFLTARDALDDKLRGFEAGAVDWMVKPFAPDELLARIRALHAHRRAAGGTAALRIGDYALDVAGAVLRHRDRALPLHATWLALLRALVEAAPGCVSRATLVDAGWGRDAPDDDVLRSHVYQLRQAITAAFGTRPIVTERGLGYRFDARA